MVTFWIAAFSVILTYLLVETAYKDEEQKRSFMLLFV
jgi:hypothetical protein